MHAFTERAKTASSGEGGAWKCRSNCVKVDYWLVYRPSGLPGRAGDGLETGWRWGWEGRRQVAASGFDRGPLFGGYFGYFGDMGRKRGEERRGLTAARNSWRLISAVWDRWLLVKGNQSTYGGHGGHGGQALTRTLGEATWPRPTRPTRRGNKPIVIMSWLLAVSQPRLAGGRVE